MLGFKLTHVIKRGHRAARNKDDDVGLEYLLMYVFHRLGTIYFFYVTKQYFEFNWLEFFVN